jgi:hypothetical protein
MGFLFLMVVKRGVLANGKGSREKKDPIEDLADLRQQLAEKAQSHKG